MDYRKLVPSRELCEEMARLNICQDEPWLFYNDELLGDDGRDIICDNPYDHCPGNQRKKGCATCKYVEKHKIIVAPTLPRMMEELPTNVHIVNTGYGGWQLITSLELLEKLSEDMNLPNAIAKALIAIKESPCQTK